MRLLPSCLLWLAVASSAATARAQAAPPAPEVASEPSAAAKDEPDSTDADDDEAPAKPASSKPKRSGGGGDADEAPPEPAKEAKALPPPADPRADEQTPRPFSTPAASPSSARHVELGPDVGLWVRSAKGDSVSYSPGLAWGVHARSEVFEYLAASVYFNRARHEVDVPRGGLGLADTDIDQPPLEVLQLGARLEPTYRPVPELRLWLGLGAAWGRVSAEEPTTSGPNAVAYADRTGVYVEYSASLGATWDAIPNWLALSLSGSAGVLDDQRGDLFSDHQAIGTNGTTTTIGGLPEIEASYSVLFGAGMIL